MMTGVVSDFESLILTAIPAYMSTNKHLSNTSASSVKPLLKKKR
jgi:hypothetical protein